MARQPVNLTGRTFAPWEDETAEPFIEFRSVTKRFGDFVAVNNVSLKIYEREFFALLGSSGCGKSTLLRMLAGFETPTEGEILLDGQNIAGVPPHKRPVNMMFQSYALFPHMTVEKNIAFGLKQDGMAANIINERVSEMLKLVQLEPFAKRKPHQLSGGQRQRVALARSLAKRPKVLLLDEPLGALDKKLRQATQFELTDIQEKLGITFIIVTHDQEEAMTVSDRIAVMDKGEFKQISTPAELYEYPNSRYTADFIGDINLIEGKVASKKGDTISMQSEELGSKLSIVQDGIDVANGAQVWVAIRPEKVSIDLKKPAGLKVNCISGVVEDIAYLGDLSVYYVRLPNGDIIKSTQTNQSRLIERPITWEDKVYLSFQRESGVVLTS